METIFTHIIILLKSFYTFSIFAIYDILVSYFSFSFVRKFVVLVLSKFMYVVLKN